MKADTLHLIQSILTNDLTVSPEIRENILKTARQTVPRRKLINAKRAMEILEISRPTLRSYVKQGKLTQINHSSRRVRFDELEVICLANTGRVSDWPS